MEWKWLLLTVCELFICNRRDDPDLSLTNSDYNPVGKLYLSKHVVAEVVQSLGVIWAAQMLQSDYRNLRNIIQILQTAVHLNDPLALPWLHRDFRLHSTEYIGYNLV